MNGVLIYAFNNQKVDYFQQACWCADRVKTYLGLPVTLITDTRSVQERPTNHDIRLVEPDSGGRRVYNIVSDSQGADWFNANRYQSLELSPYHRTLVLDSDYIVCSRQLLTLFDSKISVTAMKNVHDLTNRDAYRHYQHIGPRPSLHHYWATVLYFDRSQTAKDFFSVMTMIRKHYQHYSNLYGFPINPYRNDFAVSIALNTVYGHLQDNIPEIPWSMINVDVDVVGTRLDQHRFEFEWQHTQDATRHRCILEEVDFHFMNKKDLAKLYENQI